MLSQTQRESSKVPATELVDGIDMGAEAHTWEDVL